MSEEIKYTFTGDASQLQKASQDAVSALENVKKAEQSVDQTGNLQNISNEVKQLASYYNMLSAAQEYYNKTTMMLLAGMQAFMGTVAGLKNQLNGLSGSYGTSTAMLNSLNGSYANSVPMIEQTSSAMQTMALVPYSVSNALASANGYVSEFANRLQMASMYSQMYSNAAIQSKFSADAFNQSINYTSKVLNQFLAPIIQTRENTDAASHSFNTLSNYVDLTSGSANNFRGSVNRANNELRNTERRSKAASASISSFGSIFKKVMGQLAAYVTIRQIARALAECITLSNEYIETLNLFEVAAGNFVDTMQANADILSYYGGISRATVLNAQGSFKLLTTEMGVVEDKAAIMSNSLTNVAVDLSSLFNKDFETVMENLESGLQGMSRAVRKYGIDITEAGLQETAARLGITKSIENMSQAEKAQLRYATIIRQTSLSQTDFARTIQSPANMLKILKEQVKECGVAIGNAFQPLLKVVLPGLIRLTFIIQNLCNALAALTGYQKKSASASDSTADNYASVAASTGTAAKNAEKIKKSLAGFDELNILQQKTDTSSGGTGDDAVSTSGDLGFELPTYDNMLALSEFLPKLRTEADQIAESFKQWVAPIGQAFENLKDRWTTATASMREAGSDIFSTFADTLQQVIITGVVPIVGALIDVLGQLAPVMADVYAQLSPTIILISQIVAQIVSALVPVLVSLASNVLPPIISFIGRIIQIIGEFISAILPSLTPFLEGISECLGNLLSAILPVIADLLQVLMDILAPIIQTILPPLLSLIQTLTAVISKVITAIMPSLTALLEAVLVPIGEMVEEFLPFLVKILNRLLPMIGDLLASLLPPLIDVITAIIKPLMQIMQDILMPLTELLWTLLEPILEIIISVIKAVMSVLTPIIQIIVNIIDFALQPIIAAIQIVIQVCLLLGDIVAQVIDAICRIFNWLWDVISGVINKITGIIQKVVDTFRWMNSAIRESMTSLGNKISSIFTNIVNGIIWALNKVISGIEWLVNGALKLLNPLIKGLNYIPGVDIPTLKVSIPKIPQLALGGVVTGPTVTQIGEGAYDEAVIPLGNSPQMEEMLNRFAQKVDDMKSSGDVDVYVFVDSDEVATRVEKKKKRDDIVYNGGH